VNSHLTNQQLLVLLDGHLAPRSLDSATHLDDCATCRNEFENLRTSFASFRLAATTFAEHHAPTEAPARPASRLTAPRRFPQPVAWAAGLIAVAALCTVGGTVIHQRQQPAPAVAAVQSAAKPQNTTVFDEDATLLDSIDRDLSTSVPPSLRPLDVALASETTSTTQ
jgi:anti-sigma factor RsiW